MLDFQVFLLFLFGLPLFSQSNTKVLSWVKKNYPQRLSAMKQFSLSQKITCELSLNLRATILQLFKNEDCKKA